MEKIRIKQSLRERLPSFNFFWAELKGVRIFPSSKEFVKVLEEERKKLLANLSLKDLTKEENINQTRKAFKSLGIDPARYRPSQEALIRRILLNRNISLVNNAVDLMNFLSIRYRLAMGIYDQEKIRGKLLIREGRDEEHFLGINMRVINSQKKIVLADSEGVIGSPYIDSQRTKVSEESRNLIHIIYLVPSKFEEEDFIEAKELIFNFLGAQILGYWKVKEVEQ